VTSVFASCENEIETAIRMIVSIVYRIV